MSGLDAVILNEVKKLAASGSGGTPLNSIITLKSIDPVLTSDGEIYLRSGYIETDPLIYPDATKSVGASLGVTFPVIASPTSTVFDGTYHWVGSRSSTIITQYTTAWVATGLTKNIGIKPRGLGWNGTNFFAVQDEVGAVLVRKYDSSWVYSGLPADQIDVSPHILYPRGVTADNTYIYVIGTESDSVHRWTLAGVYVDEFFSVSNVTGSPADVLIVDSKFWITSRYSEIRGGVIAEFSPLGMPTGRRFTPVGDSIAMDWDGTNFWTTRYDGTVWKYSGEYVGLPRYEYSGNGTKYVRVA